MPRDFKITKEKITHYDFVIYDDRHGFCSWLLPLIRMWRMIGAPVICIGSLFCLPVAVTGQIIYTAAFTRALEQAEIEYAEPVEQWLHVTLSPRHEFMEYDLVLQNDRNDFEVRYCIDNKHRTSDIPPSIAVSRLLASIASNAETEAITVKIPTDDFLKQAFNAERGMIAYFTPKFEFSEKTYGALLSLYSADRSAIDIVLLYQDPLYDPLTMFRNIRFSEQSPDK